MAVRRKLPKWLEKIEYFVDRAIPYVLVLLTLMIIVEFTHFAPEYEHYIHYLDYLVISFFVVDLCFKWYHTHNAYKFVRLYWIDIIAVFPFYAVFRFYFAVSELFAAGESVQKILHETVLLREAKLLREAQFLRETEYAAKFAKEARIVRIIARGLRILRARWYITHWHMHKVSTAYIREHKK